MPLAQGPPTALPCRHRVKRASSLGERVWLNVKAGEMGLAAGSLGNLVDTGPSKARPWPVRISDAFAPQALLRVGMRSAQALQVGPQRGQRRAGRRVVAKEGEVGKIEAGTDGGRAQGQ